MNVLFSSTVFIFSWYNGKIYYAYRSYSLKNVYTNHQKTSLDRQRGELVRVNYTLSISWTPGERYRRCFRCLLVYLVARGTMSRKRGQYLFVKLIVKIKVFPPALFFFFFFMRYTKHSRSRILTTATDFTLLKITTENSTCFRLPREVALQRTTVS